MIKAEKLKDFPQNDFLSPVNMERWISINILYDDFERINEGVVRAVMEEVLANKWASEFFIKFKGDVGEYLQLIFWTTPLNSEKHIKPLIYKKFTKYFEENKPFISTAGIVEPEAFSKAIIDQYIDYVDYKILTITYACGIEIANRIGNLVSFATRLITKLKKEDPAGWEEDQLVPKVIPFHLAFLSSMGLSLNEINQFYFLFYKKAIQGLNEDREREGVKGNDDDWEVKFNELMESNFEPQREMFTGYCGYLLENLESEHENCFEEDWLNEWRKACLNLKKDIRKVDEKGEFVAHVDYKHEIEGLNKEIEKIWPLLDHVVALLDKAIGIKAIHEFNLFYMLMKTTGIMKEQ